MKPHFLVALLFALCLSVRASAADCCAHCGCQTSCCKVCRLVPDVKKITTPVYDCECEEFCVPGKSECCVGCDECGCRKLFYTPTCGKVRTRVKLVKTNETTEVKTFKCVVEDLCPQCVQQCGATLVPTASAAVANAESESWTARAMRSLPLASRRNASDEPQTVAEPTNASPQPAAPSAAGEVARPANPLARLLKPHANRK
ncbi:MAG: hypothetical protein WD845_10035 [Pirellulales bacterium]